MTEPKSAEQAFREFCKDPLIAAALMTLNHGELSITLARSAFMAGAKYATDRGEAEGHKS